MAKFTELGIKALRPKPKKYYDRESNGFAICVHPTGVKTWNFIYEIAKKRKYLNLGNYPTVSLSEARLKYQEAWKLYSEGKDPSALLQEQKHKRIIAPTVSELIEHYMEQHAKRHKKSWEEDQRSFDKDVLPYWGNLKAEDIKRQDVRNLLDKVIQRGSPIQANNLLEKLRKLFNFAVENDILENTPCWKIKAPTPKKPRDRNLSTLEIKTVWNSLDHAGMTDEVRRALKLILVTAQRPGEVIGMHSKEIQDNLWTIPKERTKNGKPHLVHLTKTALTLIGTKQGFIFESPRRGKPIDVNALASAVRNNIPSACSLDCSDCSNDNCKKDGMELGEKNNLGIAFFRPHDLRRTANTHLARLGIPFEIRERLLNHVKGKLDGTYNLYEFAAERQQALELWEAELISLRNEKPEAPGGSFLDKVVSFML